jgi:hypothetical protein
VSEEPFGRSFILAVPCTTAQRPRLLESGAWACTFAFQRNAQYGMAATIRTPRVGDDTGRAIAIRCGLVWVAAGAFSQIITRPQLLPPGRAFLQVWQHDHGAPHQHACRICAANRRSSAQSSGFDSWPLPCKRSSQLLGLERWCYNACTRRLRRQCAS